MKRALQLESGQLACSKLPPFSHYKTALAINPDFAEAHNNLGNSLSRSCREDEAITQYRAALDIEPDYVEALNGLGNAWHQTGPLGRGDSANYNKALAINPGYSQACGELGLAFFQAGRITEKIVAA